MSIYGWSMLLGTVAIFALYGVRCARAVRVPALRQQAWQTAMLSAVLSAAFGVVLARLLYAVLMLELDFEYEGIAALQQLLWFDINNVSFFGGALGVGLGVLLANRLLRRESVLAGMDAFAPFGALLIALFRLGEVCFGSYGTGNPLPEGSPFAMFPFALKIEVDGGYSYWGLAVCVLSAAFALLWAAIAFFGLRKRGRTGLTFTLSLFFLALPQIFCESMRKRGMFWLFVHVEELLSVVVLVAVLLYWLLTSGRKLPVLHRWAPMLVMAVSMGLIVLTEFAIDGKIFDLSYTVCYSFMCIPLVAMGVAGIMTAKRWNAEA